MDIRDYAQHFIFGETHYPTGGRYGPLHKANLDLFILLEGECTVQSDESDKHYSAGDAGLTYSRESLSVTYKAGVSSRVIWCQTVDLISDGRENDRFLELADKFDASNDLHKLLALGASLDRGVNADRFKNSIGEAAFSEYFLITSLTGGETRLPHLVEKAKNYIGANYTEPCNLDTIAEAVGINKRYLSRLFKKHMDVTPIKYLWGLREEHALHLLLATSLPIAELAHQSGFKNAYHFSNYIKKKYEKYPTEIRALNENHHQLPESINDSLIKTF